MLFYYPTSSLVKAYWHISKGFLGKYRNLKKNKLKTVKKAGSSKKKKAFHQKTGGADVFVCDVTDCWDESRERRSVVSFFSLKCPGWEVAETGSNRQTQERPWTVFESEGIFRKLRTFFFFFFYNSETVLENSDTFGKWANWWEVRTIFEKWGHIVWSSPFSYGYLRVKIWFIYIFIHSQN